MLILTNHKFDFICIDFDPINTSYRDSTAAHVPQIGHGTWGGLPAVCCWCGGGVAAGADVPPIPDTL